MRSTAVTEIDRFTCTDRSRRRSRVVLVTCLFLVGKPSVRCCRLHTFHAMMNIAMNQLAWHGMQGRALISLLIVDGRYLLTIR